MRRAEVLVGVLFDLVKKDYIDNHKKSLSTLSNQIDNHLAPFFKDRSAERLRVGDVEQYKDARKIEGAKNATINLELKALRRAYSLGVEKEIVTHRPVIKFYNIGKSNRRTGFFEEHEFKKQLEALPPYAKQLLRMGYNCGWRQGELLGLTWTANYDESGQVIRLNDSKNSDGRVLPLRDLDGGLNECGLVIEEQKEWRVKGCDRIFHIHGRPIQRVTFHRHWRKACVASGVQRHFHDLRRTAVRNLTRAGVHRTIAKMITGHETDDIFERYDIVDEADISEALTKMRGYLKKRNGEGSTTAGVGNDSLQQTSPAKESLESSDLTWTEALRLVNGGKPVRPVPTSKPRKSFIDFISNWFKK